MNMLLIRLLSEAIAADKAGNEHLAKLLTEAIQEIGNARHMTFIVNPRQNIDEVLPTDRRWVIANAVGLIAGYRNCASGETEEVMQRIVDYLRAALTD